jgi:serine protease
MRARPLSGMILSLCLIGASSALHSATTQESEPQQIIVKWREPVSLAASSPAALRALTQAEASLGVATTAVRMLATGGELMELSRPLSKAELAKLLAALRSNPLVQYAEEDSTLRAMLDPNDELYREQTYLFNSTASIKVPVAWDRTDGRGVTVALLDSGYRHHPDLTPSLLEGYDFIDSSLRSWDGTGRDSDAWDPGDPDNACDDWYNLHGTLLAGIIGSQTNNRIGIAGVASGARILPVRVTNPCGFARMSDVAEAIRWAAGGSVSGVPANANPARVINLALGEWGECTETLQDAIDYARSRGAIVVAAAGNNSGDERARDASGWRPGNCNSVVVVSSVNPDGTGAEYSNVGGVVDVAAPGQWVFTVHPEADEYVAFSGTSASAALVSGVAALVIARQPSLTASDVERRLRMTAKPFPTACPGCGTGIVNARGATALASEGAPPPTSISAPAQSLTGDYTVTWSAVTGATHYVIERADPSVWVRAVNVRGTSFSYSDAPQGEYKHRVYACSNYGCGSPITGNLVRVCRPHCE